MEPILYIAPSSHQPTGCLILDEQHRGIAATINSLHYFIQKGYGLDALKPTLKILNEYIGFHLITEEMLLSDHGCILTEDEQKKRHDKIKQFQKIAREATLCRDPNLLLNFLRKWWIDHQKEHQALLNKYLQK